MQIKLYVEGGGDSKELQIRCREGFRKLLEKSGFLGRMPRIFAGGGRTATFDQFRTSVRSSEPNYYPILLVDSEDVVEDHMDAWTHLRIRDHWEPPSEVADDQAQLMVTCMETWLIADRAALQSFFVNCLHENSLLPTNDLERRDRNTVQGALVNATRHCRKTYSKGKLSFELLAEIDPNTLKRYLSHFLAFVHALENHSRD